MACCLLVVACGVLTSLIYGRGMCAIATTVSQLLLPPRPKCHSIAIMFWGWVGYAVGDGDRQQYMHTTEGGLAGVMGVAGLVGGAGLGRVGTGGGGARGGGGIKGGGPGGGATESSCGGFGGGGGLPARVAGAVGELDPMPGRPPRPGSPGRAFSLVDSPDEDSLLGSSTIEVGGLELVGAT